MYYVLYASIMYVSFNIRLYYACASSYTSRQATTTGTAGSISKSLACTTWYSLCLVLVFPLFSTGIPSV